MDRLKDKELRYDTTMAINELIRRGEI